MQRILGSANFAIKCIQRAFVTSSDILSNNAYSVAYQQNQFWPVASRYSTMATYTDSPVWVNKMKIRFNNLDLNKDGVVNENDIIKQVSTMAAKHGHLSLEEEKEICEKLKQSLGYGVVGVNPNGVTVDEYVEGMRKFVNLPDAKEHMKKTADMFFVLIDTNKDGVISFEELFEYGRKVLEMGEDMIKLMYETSDLNKDGVIDTDEFRLMFERQYFTDELIQKD